MEEWIHGCLLHRNRDMFSILSLYSAANQSGTHGDFMPGLETVMTHHRSRLRHAGLSEDGICCRSRGVIRWRCRLSVLRLRLPFRTKCGFVANFFANMTNNNVALFLKNVCRKRKVKFRAETKLVFKSIGF